MVSREIVTPIPPPPNFMAPSSANTTQVASTPKEGAEEEEEDGAVQEEKGNISSTHVSFRETKEEGTNGDGKEEPDKDTGSFPSLLIDDLEYLRSSVATWDQMKLNEPLLRAIHLKGFTRPSRIQAASLPLIMQGRDLIAQAHNGSGKTAAFSLGILSRVDRNVKDMQALVLSPTRELAKQIEVVVNDLGKFTGYTTLLAVPQGGRYEMSVGAQIVIGTPGKTFDWMKRRWLPTRDIKVLVVDEADEMIDERNNMSPQVQQIRRLLPSELQVLLFSATFTDQVKEFARRFAPSAEVFHLKRETLTLSNIAQFFRVCENLGDKKQQLAFLYCCMTIGQSIIFVNHRQLAYELSLWMKNQGHAVTLICGSQATTGGEKMEPHERDVIMNEFRRGETKVLVTTDVLSRGIDVPQVTLVVNFDLPKAKNDPEGNTVNMETYLHRIGRTGRFGLKGISISLVFKEELCRIQEVRRYYNCSVDELPTDPEELDEMVMKLRRS